MSVMKTKQPPPQSSPPRLLARQSHQIRLLANLTILTCVVVLLVHLPALSARAISFDDDQYLIDNPLVRNPSWSSARRFLTEVLEPSTVGGYYQPLAMISLMLDCAMGATPDNLVPFHLTSLLLHLANTALIILLLYLLFGRPWIAAALGLLFALHPMTVEPIPWIGERKTLLAAFFALLSLNLYLRFAAAPNRKLYLACILTYLLALMSKPTTTPLPLLMLLIDFWPLRRLKRKVVAEKIPFFLLAAVFAVITYLSQTRTAGSALPTQYSPERVPLILCHNIIFYPLKIIYPANLSSHYPFPNPLALSHPMVLAGLIGTSLLIPLLLISLRWTRALLTGWLFFFIAILPTMQIIGFSDVIASDKFAYLPSLGFLILLASFFAWLHRTPGIHAKSRNLASAALILVLAALEARATRTQLDYWNNSVTLFQHMVKVAPNALPPHNNLGAALESQGQLDQAIHHLQLALRIDPNFPFSHYNLAKILQSKGDLEKALAHYRIALRFQPLHPKIFYNMGLLFEAENNIEKAIDHYNKALRAQPRHFKAHNNLGAILVDTGDLPNGILHLTKALQLSPDYPPAQYNIAIAFERKGRLDLALTHFRRAALLEPDSPMPLSRIAWILAVSPDPNQRDPDRAVRLAQRASDLTPAPTTEIMDTLAAAYAAAGRFTHAMKTARLALAAASNTEDQFLARQIGERLDLYKQAKPYRLPPPQHQDPHDPNLP